MGKGYNRRFILRIKEMPKVKGDVLKDPVLQKIVEIIVKEFDPDKIILFGSRARGDYNEHSDYDILVLKEGLEDKLKREMEDRIRFRLMEENIYNFCDVDIIVQSPRKFRILRKYPYRIYYYIAKEGKVLYEK
mgnify:CR=1 FL=1